MAWIRVREKATGKISVKSEGVARMLKDKYEIITENVTQTDEVINSEDVARVTTPNVVAAPAKDAEVAADEPNKELDEARAKYEKFYGGKPHGRTRLETLLKLIAEKENAG